MTRERALMAMAYVAREMSRCSKLMVGAAIATPDLRHMAIGYNGPMAGGPNHCDPEACDCFHAEDNVLQRSPDRGGLWLAVTVTPCPTCARRIINSGRVSRVLIGAPYKNDRGAEELLRAHGIQVDYL